MQRSQKIRIKTMASDKTVSKPKLDKSSEKHLSEMLSKTVFEKTSNAESNEKISSDLELDSMLKDLESETQDTELYMEKELLTDERMEAIILEKVKLEQEKHKTEAVSADKVEEAQLKRTEHKVEKETIDKAEEERIEAERLKTVRHNKEQLLKAKHKKEKLERERLEAEKRAKEKARIKVRKLRAARLKKERFEQEKLKAEKLAAKEAKKAFIEAKRLEKSKLKKEKLVQEKLKAEKLAAKKAEKASLEAKRLETSKLKAEKLEQVKLKAEKLAAEKAEKERIEAQFNKEKANQLRLTKKRLQEKQLAREYKASLNSDTAKQHKSKDKIILKEPSKPAQKQNISSSNVKVTQGEANALASRTDSIVTRKSKSDKRVTQLCGNLDDKKYLSDFLANTYDPNSLILSEFLHHYEKAKSSLSTIRIRFNEIILVLDVTLNTVYCSIPLESELFVEFCKTPIDDFKIEVKVLSYEEVRSNRVQRREFNQLSHSLEQFIWVISLLSANGRLPNNKDLTASFGVRDDADFSKLEKIPYLDEIVIELKKTPSVLMGISGRLGVPHKYVVSFFNAALNIDVLEFNSPKKNKTKKVLGSFFDKSL